METAKAAALVHFLIAECPEPERLGTVRLNKACWFSDVLSYKIYGEPITGARYIKKRRGPVLQMMRQIIADLQEAGSILAKEPTVPYKSWEFASRKPPAELLSSREQDMSRHVLDVMLGHSSTDVAEMSHDMIWQLAREGEEIPLYATLADTPGPITPELLAHARSLG